MTIKHFVGFVLCMIVGLCSFIAVFGQKKTDAYLFRITTLNSLSVDSEYVYESPAYNVCGVTDGKKHKVLTVDYGCAILGDTDLIIRFNPNNTVRKMDCGHYTDAWFIKDYVTLTIKDCNGNVLLTASKNVFDFGDGSTFPYNYKQHPLKSSIWPFEEEDSMVVYGANDPSRCNPVVDGVQRFSWPDSLLADAPYREDLDTNNSVTYISRGKADIYTDNKFIIDGINDGYYDYVVSVNIPPLATQDAGVYPSSMTIPAHLQGMTITPYPNILQTPPAIPQNASVSMVNGNPLITWDAVADASSYCVQRYYAVGKNAGQEQGAEQMTYTNSITDYQAVIKGQYYWKVEAMNCAGESAESNRTNKLMVK